MLRSVLSAVALAAALSACATVRDGPAPPQTGGIVTVQLLAINDLHGQLEPPSGSNGRINATEAGGAEYLATHLKNAVARQPHSIIVAAGDLVGATPLVSAMFHDEPAIEALNAMGLALASVGNHEFDEGHEELLRLRRGGCHPKDGCQDSDGFDGARFEYLSANVVRRRPARRCFHPPRFGPSAASRSGSSAKPSWAPVSSCRRRSTRTSRFWTRPRRRMRTRPN